MVLEHIFCDEYHIYDDETTDDTVNDDGEDTVNDDGDTVNDDVENTVNDDEEDTMDDDEEDTVNDDDVDTVNDDVDTMDDDDVDTVNDDEDTMDDEEEEEKHLKVDSIMLSYNIRWAQYHANMIAFQNMDWFCIFEKGLKYSAQYYSQLSLLKIDMEHATFIYDGDELFSEITKILTRIPIQVKLFIGV